MGEIRQQNQSKTGLGALGEKTAHELPDLLNEQIAAAKEKGAEWVDRARGTYDKLVLQMQEKPGVAVATALGIGFVAGAYLFRRR